MSARDAIHRELVAYIGDREGQCAADAILSALAAAGYAVVPRKASVSMIGAGVIAALEARKTKPEGMTELGSDLSSGYAAMLAAAEEPKP